MDNLVSQAQIQKQQLDNKINDALTFWSNLRNQHLEKGATLALEEAKRGNYNPNNGYLNTASKAAEIIKKLGIKSYQVAMSKLYTIDQAFNVFYTYLWIKKQYHYLANMFTTTLTEDARIFSFQDLNGIVHELARININSAFITADDINAEFPDLKEFFAYITCYRLDKNANIYNIDADTFVNEFNEGPIPKEDITLSEIGKLGKDFFTENKRTKKGFNA